MRHPRHELLPKLLRLSAFVLFVQLLLTALIVRGVRAEVQDLMHSVGSQMMQIGERVGSVEPRTLRMNGAQLRLRVQRVAKMTLDEVLDVFESRCRARNGRFYEQLMEGTPHGQLAEPQFDLLDGVMRVESRDAGSVACFDVGDERASPETILQRAQRFASTGDASSFGELRYMRAERRQRGVFVVMMWTDGPFNIKQMFPRQGDAPGVDFPDLPRPPGGSRRIFSAWEQGQAPALNIYESSALTPQQLDQHYRAELAKLGWQVLNPTGAQATGAPRGLLVMRDGVTVTLSNSALEGGRLGMTTIMPMDTAGATSGVTREPAR
jgi:hypothetical protein